MTDEADKRPTAATTPTAIKVGAVVAGGIAVNLMSDQVPASPPVVLSIALLGLLLLVAAERSPSLHISNETEYHDQAKFALASLLVGATVGAAWTLPIWDERTFQPPWGWAYFYNYEFGAATSLAALACISAVRRREALLWMIFLASAVAGMSLAVASLRDGHAFITTFLGWLLYSAVVTFIVSVAPDLGRIFADFLGIRRQRKDDPGPAAAGSEAAQGKAVQTRPKELQDRDGQ